MFTPSVSLTCIFFSDDEWAVQVMWKQLNSEDSTTPGSLPSPAVQFLYTRLRVNNGKITQKILVYPLFVLCFIVEVPPSSDQTLSGLESLSPRPHAAPPGTQCSSLYCQRSTDWQGEDSLRSESSLRDSLYECRFLAWITSIITRLCVVLLHQENSTPTATARHLQPRVCMTHSIFKKQK